MSKAWSLPVNRAMDRRTFVASLIVGITAVPASTRSQGRKMARIGWVGGWYTLSAANGLFEAFRQGMRELGYVEGQTVTIEARWMEGTAPDEAAGLSAELVRSNIDVLVAQGHAVLGAKPSAASVPIVFVYSGDPVGAKIVPNLGRPGGNLTGITLQAVDLAGKRIESLKEAAPRISRLAAFVNPLHPGEDVEFRESEVAARRLALTLRQFSVRTVGDVSAALVAMPRDRIDGVVLFSNALIMSQRKEIAEFALKYRVPTISSWEDFAVDGNFMTYGPDLQESGRSVATYVDKILKGARPADLPVEQPRKPQLVINLKTAKALGLTLPPSLLLRADRVVD
jgi:putative tryptophan/tyrosine transport system substrate-binding protein